MKFDFDIDLDNLNPSVWFGDTPGKKVCLRLCTPDKTEEFRTQCLTPKKRALVNPETGRMELVDDDDFDRSRFVDLVNGFCIADWDLKDVNGKAIACTDENKKIMMNVPRFAAYIKECLDELSKMMGLRKEEESKNSLSG